ncbi:prorelaxin [Fukomys damarensis]|uniref:Prorelaxin n=1 Tax=Fukomys damarensis TaxID=885580 RepID=A0A091EH24_FUKDA|nr:prorelaxin [Fukomys damarensis]KFO34706.1 Prorelaxin [Fukomys damarensis]
MLRLFSFHLLEFWLLLSPASGVVPPGWLDEVIKLCGRELARAQIHICGKVSLRAMAMGQEEERLLGSGSPTETMISSINKDLDYQNMLQVIPNLPQELKAALSERQPSLLQLKQYVPALRDSNVGFQDLKKIIHNTHDEAEDNSHPVLKYLDLNTHSPKKRQLDMSVSEKCCQVGCTRRSIAKLC